VTTRLRWRLIASRNASSPSGRPINSLRRSAAKTGSSAHVETIGEARRAVDERLHAKRARRRGRPDARLTLEWGQSQARPTGRAGAGLSATVRAAAIRVEQGVAGPDPRTYLAIDGPGARGRRQGASLNLAPEASTILLSLFQNPCYAASFDQKTPPIAAGFNEAGMVDLRAAGRRTAEPKREFGAGTKNRPRGSAQALEKAQFAEGKSLDFPSSGLDFPSPLRAEGELSGPTELDEQ